MNHLKVHFLLDYYFSLPDSGNPFLMLFHFSNNKRCPGERPGIKNFGNSCFFSVSMQSLFHSSAFINYFYLNLDQFPYNNLYPKNNNHAIETLKKIIKNYLSEENPLDCSNLVKECSLFNSSLFEDESPQDSGEFLIFFLNNLHDELVSLDLAKLTKKSIVSELFFGSTTNLIRCEQCKTDHSRIENFFSMNLNIPDKSKYVYTFTKVKLFSFQEDETLTCNNIEIIVYKDSKVIHLKNEIVKSINDNKYNISCKSKVLLTYLLDSNKMLKNLLDDEKNVYSELEKGNEIIFYQISSSSNPYLFVYPFQQNEKIEYLSYPILIEVGPGMKVVDLKSLLLLKLTNLFTSFEKTPQLTLYIYHNNSFNCLYCNQSDKLYCPLLNFCDEKDLLQNIIVVQNNHQIPFILLLEIPTYSPNSQIYLNLPMKLEVNKKSLLIAKHAIEIKDCIDYTMEPENLSDNNKYFCEECKGYQNAIKTVKFEKMPYNLIIQFNRNHSKKGISTIPIINKIRSGKDERNIIYPVNLDHIEHGCIEKYELFAIIIHKRKLKLGPWHYIVICKEDNGKWYKFDDSKKKEYKKSTTNKEAYLLIYKKSIEINK